MTILSSVNLIPDAPVRHIVELAIEAERLGFDRCWVSDEALATRDAFVTLAAIGLRTRTLRIGTGFTDPSLRDPKVTCNAVATLQELTGGRTFLGVRPPNQKDSALALGESVAACRLLFSGEPTSYRGQTVSLRDEMLGFADPETEIWVLALDEDSLRIGATAGDGIVIDICHHEILDRTTTAIREAGAETGNSPKICLTTMIVTSEAEMAAARPHAAQWIAKATEPVTQRLGLRAVDVVNLRNAVGRDPHEAAQMVREEWIRPFVIAGSPSECAFELTELIDRHGIDEFIVPILDLRFAVDTMQSASEVFALT